MTMRFHVETMGGAKNGSRICFAFTSSLNKMCQSDRFRYHFDIWNPRRSLHLVLYDSIMKTFSCYLGLTSLSSFAVVGHPRVSIVTDTLVLVCNAPGNYLADKPSSYIRYPLPYDRSYRKVLQLSVR